MHSSIASPGILRFMESKSFLSKSLGIAYPQWSQSTFPAVLSLVCLAAGLQAGREPLPFPHCPPHPSPAPASLSALASTLGVRVTRVCGGVQGTLSASRTSNDSSNGRHRSSFRHPSRQHPTQTTRGKLISLRADCALGRLYPSYVSQQTKVSFTRISISLLVTGEGNSSQSCHGVSIDLGSGLWKWMRKQRLLSPLYRWKKKETGR